QRLPYLIGAFARTTAANAALDRANAKKTIAATGRPASHRMAVPSAKNTPLTATVTGTGRRTRAFGDTETPHAAARSRIVPMAIGSRHHSARSSESAHRPTSP